MVRLALSSSLTLALARPARTAAMASLLAALATLAASPSKADALVLTEDFELPDIANFQTFNAGSSFVTATNTWQVATSGVDLFEDSARPEAVAFDGGQAVDLSGSPGAGVMSTTFTTVAGQSYELTFHFGRNNGIGAATADALVEVIGSTSVLSNLISHGSPDAFSLQKPFAQAFVADAALSTLRFTSLEAGVNGITIDAISIQSVAAPVGAFPYTEK